VWTRRDPFARDFRSYFFCLTLRDLQPARPPRPFRNQIALRFARRIIDKALRDLAVQANCNISYEPSMVAGLQAPPISGEFTVGRVLSLLLKGTKLRAIDINENTIQIQEKPQHTPQDSASARDGHYVNGAASGGPMCGVLWHRPPMPTQNSSTAPAEKSRDSRKS